MTRSRFTPTRGLFAVISILLALTVFSAACAPRADVVRGQTLALATSSENGVEVSITLERTPEGTFLLHATFIPPEGNHLYSKDIPITGVDGLGRPTLLELTADSKMQALGSLGENVSAIDLDFEYQKLPIYPVGAVTLSIPISLPPGTSWVDDVVSVTYMACNDTGCKPPVLGKLIAVRVPGMGSISK
jgi:hypothetical protein